MSGEAPQKEVGTVSWRDLTVKNAADIRDFYSEVVGWKPMPIDMGDYEDYAMLSPDGRQGIAGICHARGSNANLPPQWLVYITVADLDDSVRRCVDLGGKVVDGPREMEEFRFCVIQDPAGAVCALSSQQA